MLAWRCCASPGDRVNSSCVLWAAVHVLLIRARNLTCTPCRQFLGFKAFRRPGKNMKLYHECSEEDDIEPEAGPCSMCLPCLFAGGVASKFLPSQGFWLALGLQVAPKWVLFRDFGTPSIGSIHILGVPFTMLGGLFCKYCSWTPASEGQSQLPNPP